ncbi:MAG TPA: hypothetical protein VNI54_17155 [Thermoanaerobaculia bacterium]|nr:hypothetical protein [Thermoanaerobaculia bacterium]
MPRLPLVLALLVSLSASAGEIPITPLTYAPSSVQYTRRDPVVLTHGDGFLVTWEQALFGAYYPVTAGRAYDADGNPLRPEETILGSRGILWTGEEYLVINDVPAGRWGITLPQPLVRLRRLHQDLTDAAPEVGHFTGTSGSQLLSAAWNGTHAAALVILDHKRLLLFDRQGALVSDTPADVNATTVAPKGNTFLLLSGTRTMHVTEGNGRYAVADQYGEADHIAILDANGAEVERVLIAGARSTSWDGSRWHTATLDSAGRVCTSDFTSAADVRTQCRTIAGAKSPAVGAIPGRTFLAWEGADEQIVSDSGIASTMRVLYNALASAVDATGLLLAWQQDGIRFGGFTVDGRRRQEFFIPGQYGEQLQLAPNGDLTMILWRSNSEFFAMRLTAEGQPLHPILALGRGNHARVVAVNDGWLVARTDEDRVYATPISREAVAGTPQEIASGAALFHTIALAAVPGGALVTWSASELTHVNARRLDDNGIPVSMANTLPRGVFSFMACSASACLVPLYTTATVDVILIDFDGRPLTEPKPLMARAENDVVSKVAAMPDGSFRLYTIREIGFVAPDGTPRGSMRWQDGTIAPFIAGVEVFNDRTYFFYSRDGRVYLRDLPPRSRAVRH